MPLVEEEQVTQHPDFVEHRSHTTETESSELRGPPSSQSSRAGSVHHGDRHPAQSEENALHGHPPSTLTSLPCGQVFVTPRGRSQNYRAISPTPSASSNGNRSFFASAGLTQATAMPSIGPPQDAAGGNFFPSGTCRTHTGTRPQPPSDTTTSSLPSMHQLCQDLATVVSELSRITEYNGPNHIYPRELIQFMARTVVAFSTAVRRLEVIALRDYNPNRDTHGVFDTLGPSPPVDHPNSADVGQALHNGKSRTVGGDAASSGHNLGPRLHAPIPRRANPGQLPSNFLHNEAEPLPAAQSEQFLPESPAAEYPPSSASTSASVSRAPSSGGGTRSVFTSAHPSLSLPPTISLSQNMGRPQTSHAEPPLSGAALRVGTPPCAAAASHIQSSIALPRIPNCMPQINRLGTIGSQVAEPPVVHSRVPSTGGLHGGTTKSVASHTHARLSHTPLTATSLDAAGVGGSIGDSSHAITHVAASSGKKKSSKAKGKKKAPGKHPAEFLQNAQGMSAERPSFPQHSLNVYPVPPAQPIINSYPVFVGPPASITQPWLDSAYRQPQGPTAPPVVPPSNEAYPCPACRGVFFADLETLHRHVVDFQNAANTTNAAGHRRLVADSRDTAPAHGCRSLREFLARYATALLESGVFLPEMCL